MKKTLLFELLNTFSVGELRRWSAFVHSDYHCKNIHLRHLSTILLTMVKHKRKLAKQDAWKHLFPKVNYNEIKLNNYLSDLLAVSYHFLEEETFSQKQNLQFEYLQQQLIDRGLKLHATRVAKKWDKSLSTSQLSNLSSLFDRFQYHSTQNDFGILSENIRAFDKHLQEKSILFEHFYLLQQLTNYAEMLNSLHVVRGEYELSYLDELLFRYKENKLNEQGIKSIEILVLIVEMLSGQQAEQKFISVEALMKLTPACFSQPEERIIYNYLINFCVKKINSGTGIYYHKLFSIYKTLIKEGILLQNNSISQWTYTNIITIGLRLKEWDWTQNFLENHQEYLPETERHNAFHYNLAAFHFERAEFDSALSPLNELRFADAFYQMAAKTILLKIYYLKDQMEAFDSLAAASRQFIFRNKQLSDYQQKSNINFIKFLKKLYSFRQKKKFWNKKKKASHLVSFKEKLADPDYLVSHKGWLKQELEKLNK